MNAAIFRAVVLCLACLNVLAAQNADGFPRYIFQDRNLPFPVKEEAENYTIEIRDSRPTSEGKYAPADYSLVVNKASFALTVLRGKDIVAQTAMPSITFEVNGKREELTTVKSVERSPIDSIPDISFRVATTVPNLDMVVQVSPGPSVEISVSETRDSPQSARNFRASFLIGPSGHWYGANVTSGHNWPLETAQLKFDPFLATSNQTSPLWLTSRGIAFEPGGWRHYGRRVSEAAFSLNNAGDGLFTLSAGTLTLHLAPDIVNAWGMATSEKRPRRTPPRGYFTKPIFNTWIEFLTKVNQQGVLEYGRKIRALEFPCEVLDIDDRWQTRYGDYTFDPEKFPDPKAMMDELHKMGFKVALWAVPFVNLDAKNYDFLKKQRYLVMDGAGKEPYRLKWWNGEASQVDFSNPDAYRWYVDQLKKLQKDYGVDGFKLDGGDAEYLDKPFTTFGHVSANEYTDLFAKVGTEFEINELRVGWQSQEYGLVERLRDKNSDWSRENGIGSLIPHGLTEGLLGYVYFCPDMIGGGLDDDWKKGARIDPELFVRWTEASALMPMMQFSYAPWHLDEAHSKIVLKYAQLHEKFGDEIYQLAEKQPKGGEWRQSVDPDGNSVRTFEFRLPIVRPLFFLDPSDLRTYDISDEFMLGDRYLVAPVLKKGAVSRDVYLPKGNWTDYWYGKSYEGGRVLDDYPAPLDMLPIFIRENR